MAGADHRFSWDAALVGPRGRALDAETMNQHHGTHGGRLKMSRQCARWEARP